MTAATTLLYSDHCLIASKLVPVVRSRRRVGYDRPCMLFSLSVFLRIAMRTDQDGRSFQREFFAVRPDLWAVSLLFDHLPGICFFAKDHESRFVKMNAANLELYGLQEESNLLGKTDRDFHPPELAEAYLAEDRRVMESKTATFEQTWLVPYIDGRLQWFVCSKTPIPDSSGKVIGIAGVMYQIATPQEEASRFMRIAPAVRHLEEHFDRPTPLSEIAKLCGLSLTQFNRLFRSQLQMSPSEFRTALRVQRAQSLLRHTKIPIATVAIDCGFCDHSHLTKHFKKVIGLTPSDYRATMTSTEATPSIGTTGADLQS